MPQVRIEPSGIEFDAREGETLMDAAHEAGYYWPTTCGGQAICTTCACVIVEGADGVDAMGRAERAALEEGRGAMGPARFRLGCQAHVYGDVVVRKPGVGPIKLS